MRGQVMRAKKIADELTRSGWPGASQDELAIFSRIAKFFCCVVKDSTNSLGGDHLGLRIKMWPANPDCSRVTAIESRAVYIITSFKVQGSRFKVTAPVSDV